jgi:hypothetical protein
LLDGVAVLPKTLALSLSFIVTVASGAAAAKPRNGRTYKLPANATSRNAEKTNGSRTVRFHAGLLARISGGQIGRVDAETIDQKHVIHRTKLKARHTEAGRPVLELYAQHQLGAPDGAIEAGPDAYASLTAAEWTGLQTRLEGSTWASVTKRALTMIGLTNLELFAMGSLAADGQIDGRLGMTTIGVMGITAFYGLKNVLRPIGMSEGTAQDAQRDDTMIRSLP